MNFKDFYYESINTDTFRVYHGGKKWETLPTSMRESIKGRRNYGTGIYTTNFLSTARKYAGGSRVVHLLEIDSNYNDIRNVTIDTEVAVNFIKNLNGLRNKKDLIDSCRNFSERTHQENIPLFVLHNLIINSESAPGKVGKAVTDFLVSLGADGEYVSQSGDEFWLVIYNPKIIKNYKIVDSKKEGKEFPFELPSLKNPYSLTNEMAMRSLMDLDDSIDFIIETPDYAPEITVLRMRVDGVPVASVEMDNLVDNLWNFHAGMRASIQNKGFGPLLYDIALEYITNYKNGKAGSSHGINGISSSPSAQKVWEYYYKNRPDVEKHDNRKQHANFSISDHIKNQDLDKPWLWAMYSKPLEKIPALLQSGHLIIKETKRNPLN